MLSPIVVQLSAITMNTEDDPNIKRKALFGSQFWEVLIHDQLVLWL